MAVIEHLEGVGILAADQRHQLLVGQPLGVYSMNGSTAFRTIASSSVGSKAIGAGSSPFWSRMAAAWRASIWTIAPAVASTSFDVIWGAPRCRR